MSTSLGHRPQVKEESRTSAGRSAQGHARRSLRRFPVPVLLLTLLVILVILPLALVLLSSFTTTAPRPGNISLSGLTFGNYATLLSAGVGQASVNSLLVGLGSSLIAMVTGGFLAFITARSNVRARKFLYFVGFLPMLLPSYVGALAWGILGSPNAGLLNVLARDLGLGNVINIYGMGGLIFVLGIYYAPYSFLLIHSSFSLMNPDLEEAASVHGAPLSRVMRKVTFPLATPAILGSLILIFTLTVENFPVSQIIGGAAGLDTLPTYIYRLMNSAPSRGNEAAAVAVCLVLVVLAVTMLQRRMLAKRSFTTVSGKGIKPRKVSLGKFRTPALLLGLVYFVLSAVLPLWGLSRSPCTIRPSSQPSPKSSTRAYCHWIPSSVPSLLTSS
jgi:iron(III) transport system permease protein